LVSLGVYLLARREHRLAVLPSNFFPSALCDLIETKPAVDRALDCVDVSASNRQLNRRNNARQSVRDGDLTTSTSHLPELLR
jgi:hypothetical protein